MTWNLWWRFGDWERRCAAIVETIGRVRPDVVCLQEVWCTQHENLAEVIARQLGYTATSSEPIGRSDVGFSNAVLSRWPAELVADEPLPRHDGRPGHRRVVAARVATPWGPWPVVSTHLDHRFDDSATRQLQARRLLDRIATWRGDPDRDLPVVLGGDLNAVPDSDEIRLLTGRRDGVAGIVMSDAWEQVGRGPGFTWRHDNPLCVDSAWPDRRIDYVMVSWPRPKPVGNPLDAFTEATGPIDLDGDPVWASDHAALVVELTTPASEV